MAADDPTSTDSGEAAKSLSQDQALRALVRLAEIRDGRVNWPLVVIIAARAVENDSEREHELLRAVSALIGLSYRPPFVSVEEAPGVRAMTLLPAVLGVPPEDVVIRLPREQAEALIDTRPPGWGTPERQARRRELADTARSQIALAVGA